MSADAIQTLVDLTNSPLVFAGVTQTGGRVSIPKSRKITLAGTNAYTVASGAVLVVDKDQIIVGDNGRFIKVESGGTLIGPQSLSIPNNYVTEVAGATVLQYVDLRNITGNLLGYDSDHTALAVYGDVTIGETGLNALPASQFATNTLYVVGGDLNVTSPSLTIGGLDVTGKIFASTVNVTTTGATTITGGGTFSGASFGGATTFGGDVAFNGATAFTTGAATFNGAATFSTTVSFSEAVTFNGLTTFNGAASVVVNKVLTVGPNGSLATGSAGVVTVNGGTNLVTVLKEAGVKKIALGQAVTLNADAKVQTGVTLDTGAFVFDLAGSKTLTVEGTLNVPTGVPTGGTITVPATATLAVASTGALTVAGPATVAGDVTLAGTATVALGGTLNVTGTVAIDTGGSLVLAAGPATHASDPLGAKITGTGTGAINAAHTAITGAWQAVSTVTGTTVTTVTIAATSLDVTTIAASATTAILTAGTGGTITQSAAANNSLTIGENTTINLKGEDVAVGAIVLTKDANNPAKLTLATTTSAVTTARTGASALAAAATIGGKEFSGTGVSILNVGGVTAGKFGGITATAANATVEAGDTDNVTIDSAQEVETA
jgi:hypothetical protein